MEKFNVLKSTVIPLSVQDVDTDQIIPARFLKATSREGFGENLFRDWRFDGEGKPKSEFVLNSEQFSGSILLAGENFGCGSSREHEEIPFSIEAYYQEAGRAGRDGSESYPILFFKDSDFIKLRKRIQDHYPTWDELQKIYNTLSDDLGLAVGSQLSEPKNFKLDSLKKRSGIPIPIIKSGLRLLEQFGVVAMQSDVPERTQIQFTLSLEMISVFKERTENPEKGEFLDKLIRIFGHRAFSNMVEIETEFLFEKLKITRNSLIKALNVLMQHDGVLIYSM